MYYGYSFYIFFNYVGTLVDLLLSGMLYDNAFKSLNPLSPILLSISILTESPLALLSGASPTKLGFPELVASLLPI
jgi:hypothetical protein